MARRRHVRCLRHCAKQALDGAVVWPPATCRKTSLQEFWVPEWKVFLHQLKRVEHQRGGSSVRKGQHQEAASLGEKQPPSDYS
ncbi:hypothetical protein TREES_T100010824 [Tupaia chinensis]|uniref:Uncharacterized protein n=1 Tax=Tupaia chinensis TaxID=246437 RepID=L9KI27_TUPCH|nr:hypothetical protein TREES_T100010824 [Tupaia chinensis]